MAHIGSLSTWSDGLGNRDNMAAILFGEASLGEGSNIIVVSKKSRYVGLAIKVGSLS